MNRVYRDDWEDRIERADEALDRRLRSFDDAVDVALGDARPAQASLSAHPSRTARGLHSQPPGWETATRKWAGLFVENHDAFFTGNDAELGQIVVYVFSARHISDNAHYARVARETRWGYAGANPTINAYASHGRSGKTPAITLLGGALTFARLCGALRVLSEGEPSGRPSKEVWLALGRTVMEGGGVFSHSIAGQVLGELGGSGFWEDEALIRRAVTFSGGMLAGIVAHELGHLALGHTLGSAANLEVSRNQEREADSFASSVISTSIFPDPLFEGMLLWELAWTWCEQAGGSSVATTHPLSRERLLDFIRANETVALGLGITRDTLDELLPE